jgi:hypothetical protein
MSYDNNNIIYISTLISKFANLKISCYIIFIIQERTCADLLHNNSIMGDKSKKGDFKKGDSRINRGGRPHLPKEIKQARKLDSMLVEQALRKYLTATREEISKDLKNPKTIINDLIIIKIIEKALKEGDHVRLNFLYDRTIGKVPEKITSDNKNININSEVSISKALEMADALDELLDRKN